jgi:hypothetical protein
MEAAKKQTGVLLMKKEQPMMKVEGYRIPRFKWGGLIKNILTLGFAGKPKATDEALLYVFEMYQSETIHIYSETMKRERTKIEEIVMSKDEFEQLVQEKGKYKTTDYVYKFDKATFEKR